MKKSASKSTFKNSLKFYLKQKQSHSPHYSMRALARDLKLSQSYVSELMAGKKNPSYSVLKKIVQVLGLDAKSQADLETLFLKEKLGGVSAALRKKTHEEWVNMELTNFSVLEKWYYLALLEFITCDNFKWDVPWISQRLGIKTEQTQEALQFLLDHNFVIFKGERLKKTHRKLRFPTLKSNRTVRDFHSQMIKLSLIELEQKKEPKDFQRRLITGITFACNSNNVDVVKSELLKALHKASENLMDQGPCTEVYQLNLRAFSSHPIADSDHLLPKTLCAFLAFLYLSAYGGPKYVYK